MLFGAHLDKLRRGTDSVPALITDSSTTASTFNACAISVSGASVFLKRITDWREMIDKALILASSAMSASVIPSTLKPLQKPCSTVSMTSRYWRGFLEKRGIEFGPSTIKSLGQRLSDQVERTWVSMPHFSHQLSSGGTAPKTISLTASPILLISGRLPETAILSRTRFKKPSPRASMKLVPVIGLGKSRMKPASCWFLLTGWHPV